MARASLSSVCVLVCGALVWGCAGSGGSGSAAPAEREAAAPAVAPAETGQLIDSDCSIAEFETCTQACSDSSCFEWCAGPGCRVALDSLASCVAQFDERAGEAPAYEWSEDSSLDDVEAGPTAESIARVDAWQRDYERDLDRHWEQVCAAKCNAQLHSGPAALSGEGRPSDFCQSSWVDLQFKWSALTTAQPPGPLEPGKFGVLAPGPLVGSSSLLAVLTGSTIELVSAPGLAEADQRRAPLTSMLAAQTGLRLETCVDDIPDAGVAVVFTASFSSDGRIEVLDVIEAEGGAGLCVAARIMDHLRLPPRVAQDFSQLELRAVVMPTMNYFDELAGPGEEVWGADGDSW